MITKVVALALLACVAVARASVTVVDANDGWDFEYGNPRYPLKISVNGTWNNGLVGGFILDTRLRMKGGARFYGVNVNGPQVDRFNRLTTSDRLKFNFWMRGKWTRAAIVYRVFETMPANPDPNDLAHPWILTIGAVGHIVGPGGHAVGQFEVAVPPDGFIEFAFAPIDSTGKSRATIDVMRSMVLMVQAEQ